MAGTVTRSVKRHRSLGVVRSVTALTCTAGGVIDATPVITGFGRIVAVFYDGGLDASAVITVTDAKSGATLFTYTTGTEGTPARFRPTTVAADNAGTAITQVGGVNLNANRDIFVAGRVNVSVASGGVSETGKFDIVVDEALLGHPLNTAA